METFTFEDDIKVFGIEVSTFPAGIGDAFNELINATGDAAGKRNYYGISYMNNDGKIIYKAVAEEKYNGEAGKYNYAISTIEKGKYYYKKVNDWRSKTNCINQVFHEIMQDDKVNKQTPAIEMYKNDDEMLCMIKAL